MPRIIRVVVIYILIYIYIVNLKFLEHDEAACLENFEDLICRSGHWRWRDDHTWRCE